MAFAETPLWPPDATTFEVAEQVVDEDPRDDPEYGREDKEDLM